MSWKKRGFCFQMGQYKIFFLFVFKLQNLKLVTFYDENLKWKVVLLNIIFSKDKFEFGKTSPVFL